MSRNQHQLSQLPIQNLLGSQPVAAGYLPQQLGPPHWEAGGALLQADPAQESLKGYMEKNRMIKHGKPLD